MRARTNTLGSNGCVFKVTHEFSVSASLNKTQWLLVYIELNYAYQRLHTDTCNKK